MRAIMCLKGSVNYKKLLGCSLSTFIKSTHMFDLKLPPLGTLGKEIKAQIQNTYYITACKV